MKRIPLLLVLLARAVPCAPQSVDSSCKLPPDLFDRRAVLEKQLGSAIPPVEPGGMTADEIRARLKAVDEQYYQFMMALSDDAQQHCWVRMKACCARSPQDPVARLTCRLALYLTKQSTAKEFVEQFPASGDLDPLWALDEIANVKSIPNGPNTLPPLFGPDGPFHSYTTELLKLVTKDDKQALQKYLQLSLSAEGYFAEDMEDQVQKLFVEHPQVVLDNWDALKSNYLVTEVLAEEFSEDEKRQLRQKYERYCHINESACREVIRSLK